MSQISRITTWSSGQQPTAPALNGEFDSFITTWNQTDAGSANWGQVKATHATNVPLISNATGTQNIANFQSGGATASSISNSGIISNQFGICPAVIFVGGLAQTITAAQKSLLSNTTLSGSLTVPANTLSVGKCVRIDCYGSYTTAILGGITFSAVLSLGAGSVTFSLSNLPSTVTSTFLRITIIIITTSVGVSGAGSIFYRVQRDDGGTSDATTKGGFRVGTLSSFDTTSSLPLDLLGSFNAGVSSLICKFSTIRIMN